MLKIHTLQPQPPLVEVVERKGLGHPDTIADAIAERASVDYSKYFFNNFQNRFAHHWFDKVVLLGGEALLEYGRGELIRPYEVIFYGKGVRKVGNHEIPMHRILEDAASSVLQEVLVGFDRKQHLTVTDRITDHVGPGQKSTRYRPRCAEELFQFGVSQPRSNDCNLCISYWPLSTLESLVLNLERHLNSNLFKDKKAFSTGSDIKIVGHRIGESIDLLVNFPFIANSVSSWNDYLARVKDIEDEVRQFSKENYGISLAHLSINPERHNQRPYLTALGSVADTGDIGVVGRGNRANGLITPTRQMSIEAWAGKNPIDHTGKLYTILSSILAKEIYESVGVPNQVILTSSKEALISEPDLIAVGLIQESSDESSSADKIQEIVLGNLLNLEKLTRSCIFGTSNLQL